MPYNSIADAKKSGFPATLNGADLTIAQINKLASIYDQVKSKPEIDNPMGVAVAAFKKIYQQEGEKWIKRDSMSEDITPELIEMAKKDEAEQTYEMDDMPIMRTGTWIGSRGPVTFSIEDLDKIVDAFNKLKGFRDVPLKLGHTNNQKLLQDDGLPAAGWVKSLKRVGQYLVASFTKIPSKIKKLMETKAYKNLSCEVLRNYYDNYGEEGKFNKFPLVLSGIALLGADMPAVSGLGDWRSFYAKCNKFDEILAFSATAEDIENLNSKVGEDLPDECFAFIVPGGNKDNEGKTTPRDLRHLQYKEADGKVSPAHLHYAMKSLETIELSAEQKAEARSTLIEAAQSVGITEYSKEDNSMAKTVEELQKELDALTKKIGELEGDNKTKADELSRINAEREKARSQARRAEVQSFIKERIKEGKMLPSMAGPAEAILMASSEEKLSFTSKIGDKEISEEMTVQDAFSALMKEMPDLVKYEEFSKKGGKQHSNEDDLEGFTAEDGGGDENSQKLDFIAEKYIKDKKAENYDDALSLAGKNHPELIEAPTI